MDCYVTDKPKLLPPFPSLRGSGVGSLCVGVRVFGALLTYGPFDAIGAHLGWFVYAFPIGEPSKTSCWVGEMKE